MVVLLILKLDMENVDSSSRREVAAKMQFADHETILH